MSTSTPTADAPIAVGRGVDDVVLYIHGRREPLRLVRDDAEALALTLLKAARVPTGAPPHDPARAARIEALRQRGVLPPDEPPPDAHANFRAIFERNRAKVYAENPTPRSTRIGDIKGSVVLDVPDDGSLT